MPRLLAIEVNGMSWACWKRGQESKRQVEVFGEGSECGTIGSVPGDYGIEAAQTVDHVLGREQAEPVKSRCNNGLRGIGEAGQGDVLARAPDFGVVGSK